MDAYGAQYYRPPNPPAEDWEDDLERMAANDFDTVKLWAMWNSCQPAPDEFDFESLETLADLAAEYDLQVVISVILENAPHWLATAHPETRLEDQDRRKLSLQGRHNTPAGGWPGLCLSQDVVQEHAQSFIQALGTRMESHDAVTQYTVWDETIFEANTYYENRRFCYCEACLEAFRTWLGERYSGIAGLNDAWETTYTAWEQVDAPRYHGDYPRHLDWIRFRLDRHNTTLEWRTERLRETDPDATLRAHGIGGNLGVLARRYNDDWASASSVDAWGVTTFPHWESSQSWISSEPLEQAIGHNLLLDMTRGAADGKPFWQTELQAGHMRCGDANEPRGLTRGPEPTPEELALWNWSALAAGATGLCYWQYRPELLGHESPGIGLTARDGSPTERLSEARRFAQLTTENRVFQEITPIEPEIAIGVLPDAAVFNYVAEADTEQFSETLRGVYATLWTADYQVDLAKPRQFKTYDTVYLPFPLLLSELHAETIREFVETGGTLITGGAPAVYAETGRAFQNPPGNGLSDVFGCELAETRGAAGETLECAGVEIPASDRRDVFDCSTATPLGHWSDGGVGATRNEFGDGVAISLGTLLGRSVPAEFPHSSGLPTILEETGVESACSSGAPAVRTRLHTGPERTGLYVINYGAASQILEIDCAVDLPEPAGSIGAIETESGALDLSLPGHAGGLLRFERPV